MPSVTARLEWWNLNVPGAGIQRVIFNTTVTFTGEKISRIVDELDLADPQSVQFANFRRVTAVFHDS